MVIRFLSRMLWYFIAGLCLLWIKKNGNNLERADLAGDMNATRGLNMKSIYLRHTTIWHAKIWTEIINWAMFNLLVKGLFNRYDAAFYNQFWLSILRRQKSRLLTGLCMNPKTIYLIMNTELARARTKCKYSLLAPTHLLDVLPRWLIVPSDPDLMTSSGV